MATDSDVTTGRQETTMPNIVTDSNITPSSSQADITDYVSDSSGTVGTEQTSIPNIVTDPSVTIETTQTDILTTVTDSSVTTETYQTDYLPDYPSDVQTIDGSFFPNSDLTESSFSALDETNDAMLDDVSPGSFNSISQALLYDIIDPRYYNDEDAYNELKKSVSPDDETSGIVNKRYVEYFSIKNSPHRRRRGFSDWFDSVVESVANVFIPVAKAVTTAVEVVAEVATVVTTAVFGGNYEKSTTIDFTVGPNEAVDIYTHNIAEEVSIKLTCEECQVQESLSVYAKFYFRKDGILTVMDTGFVQVDGKVIVKAVAGLFVTLAQEIEKSKAIASHSISPFSVPGVFSVGPRITLEVGAFVKVEGSMGISFGAYLTWNNVHIKIDVKNPSQSEFNGLLPDDIEPKVHFQAAIEVDLGVFIQPQIEFSLTVLNDVLRAAIGLATKFIAGGKIGYDTESEECPAGLSLSPYLKFELNVFAEIGIASFEEIETDYTIYEKETPFPFLKDLYCFGDGTGEVTVTTTGRSTVSQNEVQFPS